MSHFNKTPTTPRRTAAVQPRKSQTLGANRPFLKPTSCSSPTSNLVNSETKDLFLRQELDCWLCSRFYIRLNFLTQVSCQSCSVQLSNEQSLNQNKYEGRHRCYTISRSFRLKTYWLRKADLVTHVRAMEKRWSV